MAAGFANKFSATLDSGFSLTDFFSDVLPVIDNSFSFLSSFSEGHFQSLKKVDESSFVYHAKNFSMGLSVAS